jgi:elongation factor Ts
MADISPALVKELREKTGVGMMECKKALVEADGDLDKAEEVLRKKGLSKGEKLAGRVATEGLVASYIHTGDRIGVLVEVNCQTDFVARGDEFRQLSRDIAMQIAASPTVEYVSVDDVPAEIKEREKSIEMGREDLASKPEAIREKIVLGRIEKLLKERALLDQPFIKDPNITVSDLIRDKMITMGENIKVRRFARFVLGEGLEKKEVDFAAEVAEQMKKKDDDK